MLLKYNLWIGIGILSILFFFYDFSTTYFDSGMMNEMNQQLASAGLGGDVYSLIGISKEQFLIGQILFELIPGIFMIYYGMLRKKQFKQLIDSIKTLIKIKERKIFLPQIPHFELFDTDKLLKYIRSNVDGADSVTFNI